MDISLTVVSALNQPNGPTRVTQRELCLKKKERERDTEEKVSISSLGNLSLSLSHGQRANQVLSFSICLTNQIWQVDWSEQAANVRSLWGKNVSHYILERNVHFR